MPIPTKESCRNVLTSGSNIQTTKTVRLITPSVTEFLVFVNYSFTGFRQIRSSTFRMSTSKNDKINLFEDVQDDSKLGITSLSSRRYGSDSEKVP